MKIGDKISTSSVTRTAAPARASRAVPVAPVSSVAEPQKVLGIPPAELTPRVRDVLVSLMQEVEVLRRELEQTQERLAEAERLADTDTLSPVANRRAFVRDLSRVMSYAERYGVQTAILFFDVDGLKDINDTYGHAAGDALLIHVAETLRAHIRTSDAVGRLGGDEFGVIMTHVDETQATQKAEMLQQRIAETPVLFEGHTIRASASVGVYIFGPGETPTNVLAQADRNMYKQKKARRAKKAKTEE